MGQDKRALTYVAMVHPSGQDNKITPLNSASLRDLLLDASLADRLATLGLQLSCDLWVLALGELIYLHPEFSYLLDRISQDFAEQGGIRSHSLYRIKIESFSQLVFTNVDSMFHPTPTEHVLETTTIRVTLSIQVQPHVTVYWEALLADSYLPQDSTLSPYDRISNVDFCLHLLSRAHNNDISARHWAQPPISSWRNLLPKPTVDIFTDWLCLKKLGQRDLNIFQERMGLISGSRKTLEEVGQKYEITRERVRQIADRYVKHLFHPTRRQRLLPFRAYLKKLFEQHGGVMSLGEISSNQTLIHALEGFSTSAATELILHSFGIFEALGYDYTSGRAGSDIYSVTWHLAGIEPERINRAREMADSLVDRNPGKYSFEELVKEVAAVTHVTIETVRASLRTCKLIEQDQNGLLVRAGGTKYLTVPAMALMVLRETGVPLHFTAIAEKVNNRFPERNLKPNHVLNSLDSPIFRWVDRGTYGLAEWGLPEIRPKENYRVAKNAVRVTMQKIGRPATSREIDETLNVTLGENPSLAFLSTTRVILQSNPQIFVSLGFSKWGLVEWSIAPQLAKDTVSLACEILAEDETAWLTTQQLYIEMKSRGWTGPTIAVQRALDREVLKPQRRIRKEELRGFNIRLYGLSSRDWNEETVLKSLLAD